MWLKDWTIAIRLTDAIIGSGKYDLESDVSKIFVANDRYKRSRESMFTSQFDELAVGGRPNNLMASINTSWYTSIPGYDGKTTPPAGDIYE